MTADLRISAGNVTPLKNSVQTRQQALSGYEASKEVDRQARNTKPMDEPAFRRAVAKLNETLSRNQPLRDDVPRGFYLNIRA